MKQENREQIEEIFERKTGVNLSKGKRRKSTRVRVAFLAAVILCFLSFSAFSYRKFSSIDEDDVAFRATYMGDGVVCINVNNQSDKKLEFQEKLKLMQWVDSQEVEGNVDLVQYEGGKVKAHTTGQFYIDLSEAYDIQALEQPLEDGNWYYLVLTNNYFAFGQDWMCTIDFTTTKTEPIEASFPQYEQENHAEKNYPEEIFAFTDWTNPVQNMKISFSFGEQPNGKVSDHITIAGEEGDSVFAVTDGCIKETGFDSTEGNYIVLETEDGTLVKYGHLQNALVEENQTVVQGEEIGTVGKTGMATGPNLSFTVYVNGEPVNPLEEAAYTE